MLHLFDYKGGHTFALLLTLLHSEMPKLYIFFWVQKG